MSNEWTTVKSAGRGSSKNPPKKGLSRNAKKKKRASQNQSSARDAALEARFEREADSFEATRPRNLVTLDEVPATPTTLEQDFAASEAALKASKKRKGKGSKAAKMSRGPGSTAEQFVSLRNAGELLDVEDFQHFLRDISSKYKKHEVRCASFVDYFERVFGACAPLHPPDSMDACTATPPDKGIKDVRPGVRKRAYAWLAKLDVDSKVSFLRVVMDDVFQRKKIRTSGTGRLVALQLLATEPGGTLLDAMDQSWFDHFDHPTSHAAKYAFATWLAGTVCAMQPVLGVVLCSRHFSSTEHAHSSAAAQHLRSTLCRGDSNARPAGPPSSHETYEEAYSFLLACLVGEEPFLSYKQTLHMLKVARPGKNNAPRAFAQLLRAFNTMQNNQDAKRWMEDDCVRCIFANASGCFQAWTDALASDDALMGSTWRALDALDGAIASSMDGSTHPAPSTAVMEALPSLVVKLARDGVSTHTKESSSPTVLKGQRECSKSLRRLLSRLGAPRDALEGIDLPQDHQGVSSTRGMALLTAAAAIGAMAWWFNTTCTGDDTGCDANQWCHSLGDLAGLCE